MVRGSYLIKVQLIVFLLIFLAGTFYQTSGEELTCQGELGIEILINKFDVSPKEAKGEIQYCSRECGQFRARLHLENLFPKIEYLLTLNGISESAGNKQLMKKCKRRGNEGYCDFQTIKTDSQGKFDDIVHLNLEPGDYKVKFFVKNLKKEPKYQVVLLNDDLSFTVLAEERERVEILSPTSDSQVEHTTLIRGKVSDPNLSVNVLVHPLLTNLWWVQPLPSAPNKDGSWQSIAYFGTKEGKGIGEYFEIQAIAVPNETVFREGKQVGIVEFMQLKKEFAYSDIILVKRIR